MQTTRLIPKVESYIKKATLCVKSTGLITLLPAELSIPRHQLILSEFQTQSRQVFNAE